jgi:class 3 adenylate cyclase
LQERIPGFKVKLGFGLHLGWAIEGMIGSNFKADASYLSP